MLAAKRRRPCVLFITDVTGPGGVGTHMCQLASAGLKAGWDVAVLMDDLPATDGMADLLRQVGIPVHRAGLYRAFNTEQEIRSAVLSAIDEVQPDVIHVHCGSPRSAVVPRELALEASIPLIVAEHYVSADIEIAEDQLERIRTIYRQAYAVIANCEENRIVLQENFGLHAKRQVIIRYGVDLSAQESRPEATPAKLKVITTARLVHRKGIDVLIRAVAALPHEIRDRVTFTLVGDGEEETQLKQMAHDLGVDECIDFAGWSDDTHSLLRTHDLFVLPSRSEGQPIALMDALATGLPCIASAVSGIPEFLGEGAFGALVPPDDPEALCAAITSFVREPGVLQKKAASARSYLEMNHDLEKNSDKIIGLWEAATTFSNIRINPEVLATTFQPQSFQ